MGNLAQRAKSKKNHRKNPIWNGAKGFFPLPKDLMDTERYQNLKPCELKLLLEAMYQYNGTNNGNLSFAYTDMKERGFTSKSSLERARIGLVEKELLIISRQGFSGCGGHRQCTLYALSWIPIQECRGVTLDIKPTIKPIKQLW